MPHRILKEKANQIQSMLAKRAAKSSTKNRKRVKTEDRPAIISGEVIDLT
jgi:ribosomal protein S19